MPYLDFFPSELTAIGWGILTFFGSIWWLWAPYVLFLFFLRLWLIYARAEFLSRVVWTLLEIKIPSEVGKPPQAMEQVFAGLHGIRRGFNMLETYWEGKMYLWFTCEIVGRGGAISFFVWTPTQFRNLVEAQIYAQYPESEIREVEDYTSDISLDFPEKGYGMYGFELALVKEDAYPIRTYKAFTMGTMETEEQKVDPMASLTEALSKLKNGEELWIQIYIRPTADSWKQKGMELVDKLLGRKKPRKKGFVENIFGGINEYIGILSFALLGTAKAPVKKEEKKDTQGKLSPGEQDIIKAIEQNISKIGFDTAIRILYIAKRDVFDFGNIAALGGAFNQFNDLNLNGFKRVNGTSVDYLFKARRELHLKKSLLLQYQRREKPAPAYAFSPAEELYKLLKSHKKALFVFNIEELATIFHIPGGVVTTASLPRVEAKRAAPPINLPLG